MSTIAEITAGFPCLELPEIGTVNTPPTAATVRAWGTALNACARSSPSKLCGGVHGHIFLTMKLLPLTRLTGGGVPPTPTKPPDDPPAPVLPDGSLVAAPDITSVMLLDAEKKWKRRCTEYETYHNTSMALANLITKNMPDVFISSLHCEDLGYSHRTPREFVTLIETNYASITGPDLDGNLEKMAIPWAPPAMIESLFNQLEAGQKYAFKHDKISDETVLRMAIKNITASGFLRTTLATWAMQNTLSTYTEFKSEMLRADAYRRELDETTGSAGFHSANAAFDDDVPSLSGTTTTNNSVSDAVSALTAATAANTDQINVMLAAMMNQQVPEPAPNPTNPDGAGKRRGRRRRGRRAAGEKSYCFTHGVTTNMDHTSATCDNPGPSHNVAATFDNRLGGSEHVNGPQPRQE